MRQVTFKMVAAGDGAPPTPIGYSYYLVAHAVATVLLLITLVAAVWQFMDWVVTPSCLEASSASSATSVPTTPIASRTTKAAEIRDSHRESGVSYTSWTEQSPSYRNAARSEAISSDCPCPKGGK